MSPARLQPSFPFCLPIHLGVMSEQTPEVSHPPSFWASPTPLHYGHQTLTSTSFPTDTLLNPLITSLDGRRHTVPSPLYPMPVTWKDTAGGCHQELKLPIPGWHKFPLLSLH